MKRALAMTCAILLTTALAPPGTRAEEGVPSLDLDGALAALKASNEDLAALDARVSAARARARGAAARRRGRVAVAGSLRRDGVPQPLVPLVDPTDRPSFGRLSAWQGLQASLPLEGAGPLAAESRRAGLASRSLGAARARALQDLAFALRRHFYAVLGGRETAAALRFSRQSLERHGERIRRLAGVGRSLPIDAMRIEARLAALEAQILATEREMASHARLVGDLAALEGPFRIEGRLDAPPPSPLAAEELVAEALEHRPDLRALELGRDGARAGATAARRARKGQLELQAAWGRRQLLDHGWQAEDGRTFGHVALALTWPLFDGGQLRARQDEAAAEERALAAEAAALRRRVRREVLEGRDELATALARLDATERSAAVADEALRREGASYAEGRSTLTDVLDGERALSEARSEEARARVDALVARARLDLALGREIVHAR